MVKRDIRLATFSDEAVMLEWVNSADSLNWKKNTKSKISKKAHEQWFNTRLTDKNTKIWIILHDDIPSGQVRLEKKLVAFIQTSMWLPQYAEQASQVLH